MCWAPKGFRAGDFGLSLSKPTTILIVCAFDACGKWGFVFVLGSDRSVGGIAHRAWGRRMLRTLPLIPNPTFQTRFAQSFQTFGTLSNCQSLSNQWFQTFSNPVKPTVSNLFKPCQAHRFKPSNLFKPCQTHGFKPFKPFSNPVKPTVSNLSNLLKPCKTNGFKPFKPF